MTIKSFRQRAEELEKQEFSPVSLNGKYAAEFQEWLRENRNKSYDDPKIEIDTYFYESCFKISLNKIDMDIKNWDTLAQSTNKIIINNLPGEYNQNYINVFFNKLEYSYKIKNEAENGEDKAA